MNTPGKSQAGWKERLKSARFYLIYVDSVSVLPLEDALAQALSGGVDLVQIREKESRAKRLDLVRRALYVLGGTGVPLVVNDDAAAAIECGAHGVHLGPDDKAPAEARAILEEDMLLGISAQTLEDASAAQAAGADAIGVGTVFPTETKRGKALIGPEEAARICSAVPVPAFAVGGIDTDGARKLVRLGCRRIAVCSAVLAGRDVEKRARAIRDVLDSD